MKDNKVQTPQTMSRVKLPNRDAVAQLYKSIDSSDPLKLMELRQIEQEQYYIQQLMDQRERMEALKTEFDRKERLIQDQGQQIQYLMEQNNANQQLRGAFQELIQKSEDDEYQLRKIGMEKEMLGKDLEQFKYEAIQRENKLIGLRQDKEKLDVLQTETEATLEKYKQLVQAREEEHSEVLHQLTTQNKQLREENQGMKSEISKLDEQIFSSDYLKDQNIQIIDENKHLSQLIQQEKTKNEKLLSINDSQQQVIDQLKRDTEMQEQVFQKHKLQKQNEIEKLIQQQKKMEGQVLDLKQRKKDDDKRIGMMKEELVHLKQENQKYSLFEKESHDHARQLEQRLQDQDRLIGQLKQENHDMRQQLTVVVKKDEHEKKIKKEIDKVRQDLISVRNTEVQRMNELFDGFLSANKNESQSSGFSKKGSTPSDKKQYQ